MLMLDDARVPAVLAVIERCAASARRVVERGLARFADPDDDEQRRIACSLVLDLSTAAARLPLSFREAHPEVTWNCIHAVRHFIANDYAGTAPAMLWAALSEGFPRESRTRLACARLALRRCG
ncbi:ribonuclease HepT family protein, partial [Clavibacter michiganensis]|uniref:hypothetical protein n=1 Tax=Clavibacter michiganensis TaxID=28447 RepID=UPI002930EFC2